MGLGSFDTAESTWQKMLGQESGGRQFNAGGTVLTSPTGAQGIAQVEPYTGPEAAKYAGLPWDANKLAQDPEYNKALGRAYYQHQLESFGSPQIAAAAYNAGPAAVQKALAKAQSKGGSYLDYLPKETQDYVQNVGGSPSTASTLQNSAQTDYLEGGDSPQGTLETKIAGQAAAALTRPNTASVLQQPMTDFLGADAPAVAQAAPAAQQGTLQGAIPIDPKNYIPAGTAVNVPGDVVDRTQPLSQQLGAAGRSALSYGQQQVAGVPGAISQDFGNAAALTGSGANQLASGQYLPSFPSSDPRTWSAGGVLGTLGGATGMALSPLTGLTQQAVERPVADATGNPVAGEAAGFIANSAGLPLLGKLASGAGGALASTAFGALNPEDAKLAQLATSKYGIPLTAPQVSSSPALKIAGSAVDRLPLSGAGGAAADQQGAWQRAIASTLGEKADRLTPDVMNNARQRIGSYYDTVANNTDLNMDDKFFVGLHDTLNNAAQVLPKSEAEPLVRQAQNIIEKIDPDSKTISGKTYQALTNTNSPLDRLANSENPNLAFYANQLKKTLDSALERSAPPEMQQLLQTADKQWAAMRTVQPIVAKSNGTVSPALLAGRVNAASSNGMAFGYGGDLGELARIGQTFLKEPGSSNTAERLSTIAGLSAAGPAAFNALAHGSLGEAAGILGTLGTGRVVGSALRSRALANQLINKGTGAGFPSIDALISRGTNLIGNSLRPNFKGALSGGAGLINERSNALGAQP
jgi:hypothetical protein